MTLGLYCFYGLAIVFLYICVLVVIRLIRDRMIEDYNFRASYQKRRPPTKIQQYIAAAHRGKSYTKEDGELIELLDYEEEGT